MSARVVAATAAAVGLGRLRFLHLEVRGFHGGIPFNGGAPEGAVEGEKRPTSRSGVGPNQLTGSDGKKLRVGR